MIDFWNEVSVMAALVAAIHVFAAKNPKTWMPGSEAGHDES